MNTIVAVLFASELRTEVTSSLVGVGIGGIATGHEMSLITNRGTDLVGFESVTGDTRGLPVTEPTFTDGLNIVGTFKLAVALTMDGIAALCHTSTADIPHIFDGSNTPNDT